MVKCNKCEQNKDVSEYRKPSINKCGTKGICKQCKSTLDKLDWAERYKDEEFKNKHSSNQYKYKEKKKLYQKKYDALNRDKKHQWHYNKYQNDVEYRLLSTARNRIYYALKARNESKQYKSSEYLGCDIKTYIKHLESQFDGNMNWDNYGEYWEVDHIHQLNKGGSLHYTNTRPLSVTENRQRLKGKYASSKTIK
tara:strand:- start:539 stop:1123 length:585 start_codon:yes stop_codon:yes gene_type:complete